MILISFLLPVLYWPGVAEMSNTPRWCLLALVPLLWLAKNHPFTSAHKAGLAWLALGVLSLAWAVSFLDGVQSLIRFILIASVFCVASAMSERDIKRNIAAFAIGMALNSGLAIWQQVSEWQYLSGERLVSWCDQEAIPTGFWLEWRTLWGRGDVLEFLRCANNQVTGPAGLFMNRNYLAEAGLLTLVACWSVRYWILGLLALPAAALPGSRGVYLAMALTAFAWLWRAKRGLAIALGIAAAVAFALYFLVIQTSAREQTSEARLAYYGNTAAMIVENPWGVGPGGFWAAYPPYWDRWVDDRFGYKLDQRPRTPHNDALTVLAENGIIGFLLLAFVFLRSWLTSHPLRYVVLAFLALGLANFPLYVVNTAYLCALVAGFLCSNRYFLRNHLMDRGESFLSGQYFTKRYGEIISRLPVRLFNPSPRKTHP